jgi:hypothetical protein
VTEADWRTTTDVDAMLQLLTERGERAGFTAARFRRFTAACARRAWPLLSEELRAVADQLEEPPGADPSPTWQVVLRERDVLSAAVSRGFEELRRGVADGRAFAELAIRAQATVVAGYATSVVPPATTAGNVARAVSRAVELADRLTAAHGPASPEALGIGEYPLSTSERAAQANLLRCIFGNPFRPVAFDPAWRTEAVVGLARGMDDAHDFAALPVLADALEDAGCADAELLAHARGPGPHARGCHVIDHALGRW